MVRKVERDEEYDQGTKKMSEGFKKLLNFVLGNENEGKTENWIMLNGGRTGAIIGGIVGISVGFSGAGLGGAILGALVGIVVGAVFLVLFGFFIAFVVRPFLIVAIPLGLFVLLIELLWDVGK